MITQKILEDYLNCKQALNNGRFDEYDRAVCDGYFEFYNYIQRPRDKQICKAQGRPLNARAERIIRKITRESENNG